jgi:hypothetical protein
VLGFRNALLSLMVIPLAACVRIPTPQDRLVEEKQQLIFGLNNVCLPRAFEGLSTLEIVRRAGLRPEKHLGYTGWFTVYSAPDNGLRPINFSDGQQWHQCNFNVGERNTRSDEIVALDRAVYDDLAKDSRRWRPVEPYNSGKGWCDSSNKVFVRTFESNPEKPPPAIKAYIRRMQLQVSVSSDDGWLCSYQSRPAQTRQAQQPLRR